VTAILGFSQGAAAAGILLSLLERPYLHPLWSAPPSPSLEGVEWPPRPVKCAVLAAAFGPVPGWGFRGLEEGRPETPVLHLVGRNDVVVNTRALFFSVAAG
jgi:predicted esterase